jgi:hypothetical protein
MEIKFTVQAEDLKKALKVVSIVSPQAQATTQQERGYLFVVQGERCSVYSKSGGHQARSSFPITDVEGEGPFMYPADFIEEFDFIKEAIHFAATEKDGAFGVNYKFGGDAAGVDRVSFDPRTGMMSDLEKGIQEAMEQQEPEVYSVGILQEALNSSKPFMATEKDKAAQEHFKTIQIFGSDDPDDLSSVRGFLYASNRRKSCYFQSDHFVNGRGLVMPSIHLGLLEKFMSRSGDKLRVYKTDNGYYVANNRDDVIGWPHHMDVHKACKYYPRDVDTIVVQVDPEKMRDQLQYMKATMPKDKTTVRLQYDVDQKKFWFTHGGDGSRATSGAVPANVETCKIDGEVKVALNVEYLLELFNGVKGHEIDFRILVLPPDEKIPKGRYMFRTIDEFLMDDEGSVVGGVVDQVPEGAHVCRVTRFMSGLV